MQLQILVVDDIHASRHQLCELVTGLGHVAIAAASGRSALEQLERQRTDLVLLDLLMPDLDGFEVMRQLNEQHRARWMPVIVTSSMPGDEHFIQALEIGADDYLVRPVNPGLLQAKLRHYARVLALQGRLAQLAQRQSDILDNILAPVITLDETGRIVGLNQAATALRDPAGGKLTQGMSCQQAFGMASAELAATGELVLSRGEGKTFVAEVGLSRWHDDDREHLTVVLRDLTAQREMDRMKDEFLATVSHELRTPLTSIVGALGLLAGGAAGAMPAPVLKLAEVARRNGDRLSRLIDDILDLTKLEGDRLVLHQRPQRLAPLLRESLAANQGYAERGHVTLSAEGLDDSVQHEASVDADRFLQIMANLLSNAIKHSPPDSTVRVSLCHGPDSVSVTVRDRGNGIHPAFRTHLFEKFSQADATDRRVQGGTGLGLYVTRLLVERMGGRITADEATGPGASFTITFPTTIPSAVVPVVVHIDSDFESRARVARWLAPLKPLLALESVADVKQAARLERRPILCIGNPAAQGSADAFCRDLQHLVADGHVLLLSDSIGPAFSESVGLPWLSPTRHGQAALVAAVQALLRQSAPGVRP